MTDTAPASRPAAPVAPQTPADRAVALAQSVPDLVNRLQTADPALAQQLEGKALLASKTPWGTLACAGVAYVATKYGFHWDETTVDLVSGAGLLVGAYLMRLVTTSPIAGFIRHKL